MCKGSRSAWGYKRFGVAQNTGEGKGKNMALGR